MPHVIKSSKLVIELLQKQKESVSVHRVATHFESLRCMPFKYFRPTMVSKLRMVSS